MRSIQLSCMIFLLFLIGFPSETAGDESIQIQKAPKVEFTDFPLARIDYVFRKGFHASVRIVFRLVS